MLKILQASLQQYVNWELPDVQTGFRKGRGTTDQIANIWWIMEKAREFQKNIYLCFIDYSKAFGCVDHNKLWKILQEIGIPEDFYLPPEKPVFDSRATVRTRFATTDWFQTGKEADQGCMWSPCLFNLYTVYHAKCQDGWRSSWSQDCQEKYQQPQIGSSYHIYGRKQRETKEPLDEGEWKEDEKGGLKHNIQKFKKWRSRHPVQSLHGK